MLRILAAFIAAACLLLGSTAGAWQLVERHRRTDAQIMLRQRLERLEQETRNWEHLDPASMADQASAREAARTLDMLGQLYRQEERLWAYYDALQHSSRTRRVLVAEQQERDRELTAYRERLARLQHELDRLRPPEEPDAITFSDPEGAR